MKDPYILRQGDKSPMVKIFKSLLNEVVKPSPKIVENEVFDLKTHSTVLMFKRRYELYRIVTLGDGEQVRVYDGIVMTRIWRQIGLLITETRRKEVAGRDQALYNILSGVAFARVVPEYGEAATLCDRKLARLFGGQGAVFAGNGFEPQGMPGYRTSSDRYRGADFPGTVPEHLSITGHLYGSSDGKMVTGVYIPSGYTYLGAMATSRGKAEDGHSFYYKQLGKLTDITLHIAHVANFKIQPNDKNAAESVRIGSIGGRGGRANDKDKPYIHCHFALHKGRGYNEDRRISFADLCAAVD